MLSTVRADRLEDYHKPSFPDHMEGAIYGERQERCLEQVIDLEPGYCF